MAEVKSAARGVNTDRFFVVVVVQMPGSIVLRMCVVKTTRGRLLARSGSEE